MSDNWVGQWYSRDFGKNKTWRNRRTGVVLASSGIKERKRRGMSNQAIIFDGERFKGIEKTKFHFSGMDARPSVLEKKRFEKRILSKAQLRAIHAKSKGRRK